MSLLLLTAEEPYDRELGLCNITMSKVFNLLFCKVSSDNISVGNDYFFWYRQYPGKPPQFIASQISTGPLSEPISGLSVSVRGDKKHLDLQISSAALTDSAVYYCAVSVYRCRLSDHVQRLLCPVVIDEATCEFCASAYKHCSN
uniref:Ig-like domain-containing protein n=1 Tax=Labrus bergylta TaxID=56723 RepID=A0A3Q3FH22_9LABR